MTYSYVGAEVEKFVAWLTTRDGATIFGATHESTEGIRVLEAWEKELQRREQELDI